MEVNPEMLVLARELRGMTQTQVAAASKIDQGNLSRYEHGLVPITQNDLNTLAEVLSFPVGFFYRVGKRHGVETGEIFQRKRRSVTSTQLSILYAHLNLLRLNVETLTALTDVNSVYTIPQMSISKYEGDMEDLALAVRAKWQMPSGPVSNLIEVMESAFTIMHEFDFATDQVDEVTQWLQNSNDFPRTQPLPPIILINRRIPADRLRFTLAHTLGHLVLHHGREPYPEMEDEADRFASAFLMPEEDIVRELEPVTIEHLIRLKSAWKVSIQALIYRAKDIGVISDTRAKSLFQMLSRAGYRKQEPFPIPRERPRLLTDLLDLYRDELGYSTGELCELLQIKETDFGEWYFPESRSIRLLPPIQGKQKTL